jgi:hypothetical protein
MRKLTWTQAAAWRARRHHLDRRAPKGSLTAVAGRICGLHAQVLSSAALSAWVRCAGLERGAVERALWEDRSLVKTWAMRGTLHLLPAAELPLWHAALGTNPHWLKPATWKRIFGITMEELDGITKAIGESLDGRILTREELVAEAARITGTKAPLHAMNSWGVILRPAAFTGRLCFAPGIGQRVRFTHPAHWLGAAEPVEPEAATGAVARRYLAAYGPATEKDLAIWWGGGGMANARRWLAAMGDDAAEVEVDGTRAWMPARDVRAAAASGPTRSVRLLPGFDPYVVAASPHCRRLMPGDFRARVYRQAGWISAVLLVDGMMRGTWRHQLRGSRVEVTAEPFVPVPAWVRRAAEQEAERLAAFLGGALEWRCL